VGSGALGNCQGGTAGLLLKSAPRRHCERSEAIQTSGGSKQSAEPELIRFLVSVVWIASLRSQ
jgi:hypothetical protein